MKIKIIPSPTGEDVMLDIDDALGGCEIVFTRSELHELKQAINEFFRR